jgi:hypothetical protein
VEPKFISFRRSHGLSGICNSALGKVDQEFILIKCCNTVCGRYYKCRPAADWFTSVAAKGFRTLRGFGTLMTDLSASDSRDSFQFMVVIRFAGGVANVDQRRLQTPTQGPFPNMEKGSRSS